MGSTWLRTSAWHKHCHFSRYTWTSIRKMLMLDVMRPLIMFDTQKFRGYTRFKHNIVQVQTKIQSSKFKSQFDTRCCPIPFSCSLGTVSSSICSFWESMDRPWLSHVYSQNACTNAAILECWCFSEKKNWLKLFKFVLVVAGSVLGNQTWHHILVPSPYDSKQLVKLSCLSTYFPGQKSPQWIWFIQLMYNIKF